MPTLSAPSCANYNEHLIDGAWCVVDLEGSVVIDGVLSEETAEGMADLLNGSEHSEELLDLWNT